jgi:hypothetical protein
LLILHFSYIFSLKMNIFGSLVLAVESLHLLFWMTYFRRPKADR